ncbi:MAG: DEAD/DEAH box helicase [Elusimicrobia bacterium]|nr:DEAD/DEAH box helicase [Elusimicrobiota bacterium]
MGFDRFQLHPDITHGLKAMGYQVPTPIQRDSIPHLLARRDLLGLAQTGTGKTAAFALPILQRLMAGPRGKVRALVLAPTRELAEQIHGAFRDLGGRTPLRSASVYGGVGMGPQIQALKGRADIIVACPGRLLDHAGQGHADLSAVEILVIDEADQMFDMGFLPSIRKIIARLPKSRQTMLFSATMPEEIRGLAHECLRNPVTVQIDHTVPLATVSHALYPVREHLKTELLLELIRRAGSGAVLVFTRTKHRAKKLGKKVEDAGFTASSLQGNLSQNQRRHAMDGFRDGTFQVLVATDIAARGIDISEITHVINFDVPMTPELYTHRIGRTGRAAKTGDAYTLVTEADADLVRAVERRLGRPIDRRRLEGFDYNKAPEPGSGLSSKGPRHGLVPVHRPGHGHGGPRRPYAPQHHGQPRHASGHHAPAHGATAHPAPSHKPAYVSKHAPSHGHGQPAGHGHAHAPAHAAGHASSHPSGHGPGHGGGAPAKPHGRSFWRRRRRPR